MILPLAVFAQLAASCAPSVHVDTLAAVARTESGFRANAIHDNTERRSYSPRSRAEAIAIATELVGVRRHSVDLGLMQINSANLPALGMTVEDAFDPCRSVAAGARVLVAGFRPPAAGEDPQPALLQALSRYNTGHPLRGFANGYVAKVQASARQVVPAIRLHGPHRGGQEDGGEGRTPVPLLPPPPPAPSPPAPPDWDVFAQARHARLRSPVLLYAAPPQAPVTAAAAPGPWHPPVRLQASLMADAR